MHANIKKILGVLLIIVGFIGLFLPGLQGILMIALGAYLIEYKPLNKILKKWFKKCKSCIKNKDLKKMVKRMK